MNNVLKHQSAVKTSLLVVGLLLAGCTSVGNRTQLSVGYYDVYGTNFSQLDKQIALHGPTVEGVGKALASTRVQMVRDIRFKKTAEGCEIGHATIRVKARVTLPRLTKQRTLERSLRRAWRNLEEYARVHEAVHVAIADRYAIKIEDALKQLKSDESCVALRVEAEKLVNQLLEEHEKEQLAFDAKENERIRMLSDLRMRKKT